MSHAVRFQWPARVGLFFVYPILVGIILVAIVPMLIALWPLLLIGTVYRDGHKIEVRFPWSTP